MPNIIIVIGSLNMDMVVNAPRVPVMGETLLGGEFMTAAGGKGANQAVAAARLGGNVSMIGCIGNDIFGRNLVETLFSNNVNTQNISFADGYSTGIAVITIVEGDNSIIVAPGANSKLSPERIEELEEIIKEASVIVVQLEIPLETVEKAISIAKEHNKRVILNPAPAVKLSDEFLSKIDVIIPNESECQIITGLPMNSIDNYKAAVLYLNEKGVEQVIITLGDKGVVYNNGSEIVYRSSIKVKAIDTTAAGDAFIGAIAFALTEGKDIDSAVEFACAVGALTVTRKGAQPSLPYIREVQEFIDVNFSRDKA